MLIILFDMVNCVRMLRASTRKGTTMPFELFVMLIIAAACIIAAYRAD